MHYETVQPHHVDNVKTMGYDQTNANLHLVKNVQ